MNQEESNIMGQITAQAQVATSPMVLQQCAQKFQALMQAVIARLNVEKMMQPPAAPVGTQP